MRWPIAIAALATLCVVPMASAGTISGTVYDDYNANGVQNSGTFVPGASVTATDPGVPGVGVRVYDNAGALAGTATTDAAGAYSVTVATGATVRVEFDTPAGYQPSPVGAQNATSVQFVSGAGASGVSYAVQKPTDYCQDNPLLVTCLQQAAGMVNVPGYSTKPGAFTVPSAFYRATNANAIGQLGYGGLPPAPTDGEIIAPFPSVGAAFGVGTDRQGNAYYGTFIKRHSPYGPAGDVNAIYKVNIATKAASTFTTLGNTALPAHVATAPTGWPDYAADGFRSDGDTNDVYHSVGRAGLGDVDVTPDGSTLYAVEMTESAPRLWSVPITGRGAATAPGTPASVAIPRPTTLPGVPCDGTWHPMGLGVTADSVLVGGVCGGEGQVATSTATSWSVSAGVATITTTAAHTLRVGDVVSVAWGGLGAQPGPGFGIVTVTAVPTPTSFQYATSAPNGSGSHNATVQTLDTEAYILRYDPSAQTFSTVTGWRLSYPKGSNNDFLQYFDWFPHGSMWKVWDDTAASAPHREAMLANIEVMANGDLVVAMRDRANDQTKAGAISYESSFASPTRAADIISAAELLRVCSQGGGTYALEHNGACGGLHGAAYAPLLSSSTTPPYPDSSTLRAQSPLFYQSVFSPLSGPSTSGHAFTSEGGTATLPGTPYLWAVQFDALKLNTQGLRAFGPCPDRAADAGTCGPKDSADGAALGGAEVGWDTDGSVSAGSPGFLKGNALGDLEMVCNAAPLEIGNRVWIDVNGNGLQDPGEFPRPGVTVHLYDAGGTLVGTAITDDDGTYYFSSTVSKPAGGDGTNVGGGLVAGDAFTIRLDNPADFTGTGPLAPYRLTTSDVATAPAGAAAPLINSKASTVDGYPRMSVAARNAGFNNHAFDVGFVAINPPAPPPPFTPPDAVPSQVAPFGYQPPVTPAGESGSGTGDTSPAIAIASASVRDGSTLVATVAPSTAGAVRVVSRLGGRQVSQASVTAPRAGRIVVQSPLTPWARAVLRRRAVTFTVVATITTSTGASARATAAVKVARYVVKVPVTG